MSAGKAAAVTGVYSVLGALGVTGVSATDVDLIADAALGLIDVLGKGAQKRAAEAGLAAAAKITNSDEAEKAESERK